MEKIPVYQPDLSGNERRYVDDCVDSTWISSKGKYIARFESEFAEYCDANHAIAVCNGTVALHASLEALDIGPGDEVIVPTLSYISSANAIAYTGAKPVFVDSLPDTWQLDPEEVESRVSPATKAIMPVHLYGQPADMDRLRTIAENSGLSMVEDCAEAIGSKYKGHHVGNIGNLACFSFFGNKTITTGEGGMIITNDEALAKKVSRIKGQGLEEGKEYWHDIIGYNYRMTNVCAALGVAQLESIDKFTERKIEIAKLYQEALSHHDSVTFHQEVGDVVHSYWMCSILVENEKLRDGLRTHLAGNGVETRPLFHPMHKMPMYASSETFPVAEDLSARGMNLPSWPGLVDSQVEYISEKIISYLESPGE